jgi:DivIVA domain-containing protein
MAADRPAVRPPDTLKVRGRLRAAWLALWLAGAAGCVAVGLYGDTPEDTLGSHQIFLSLFLFLAAVSVVVAVRGFGRGLDADGNGVVVRNMLRAISIPWRELAAIEFKGVDSVAISDMYYHLVFQRHDGSRVRAEAPGGGARPGDYLFELPGGGARPGEYLFELRERLLAMRYAATWPLLDATTRFETTALFLQGYATAEVDAFQRAIRDTFLGVRQPPVVSGHVRGKQFSTHRPGYNVEQVRAFLNQAAPRLAAARESRAAAGRWRIKDHHRVREHVR